MVLRRLNITISPNISYKETIVAKGYVFISIFHGHLVSYCEKTECWTWPVLTGLFLHYLFLCYIVADLWLSLLLDINPLVQIMLLNIISFGQLVQKNNFREP